MSWLSRQASLPFSDGALLRDSGTPGWLPEHVDGNSYSPLVRARIYAHEAGTCDQGGFIHGVIYPPREFFSMDEEAERVGLTFNEYDTLLSFLIYWVANGDTGCMNFTEWASIVIDVASKSGNLQPLLNTAKQFEPVEYGAIHPSLDYAAIGIHFSAANIPDLVVDCGGIHVNWERSFPPPGSNAKILGIAPQYIPIPIS